MEYSEVDINNAIRLKKRFYLLRAINFSKDEYNNNFALTAKTVREISEIWKWFFKMRLVRYWATKLLSDLDKGKIDLVDNFEQIDIIGLTKNINDEKQMIRMLKILEIAIKK